MPKHAEHHLHDGNQPMFCCVSLIFDTQSGHPPFLMTYRTFVSGALAAAMSFSLAAPAFAATSDELIEQQRTFQSQDFCNGKTGREVGRCISDVLKDIKDLRDAFHDALRIERRAWDEENAGLGVGTERAAAFKAYMKSVMEKRNTFNSRQHEIEKSFFSTRKIVRKNPAPETPVEPRKIVQIDMEAAKAKCSVYKKDDAVRVCIRQLVREANSRAVRNR
jgi:hypothetical protein